MFSLFVVCDILQICCHYDGYTITRKMDLDRRHSDRCFVIMSMYIQGPSKSWPAADDVCYWSSLALIPGDWWISTAADHEWLRQIPQRNTSVPLATSSSWRELRPWINGNRSVHRHTSRLLLIAATLRAIRYCRLKLQGGPKTGLF